MKSINRRNFIKKTSQSAIALTAPFIVPSSVFGKNAPSNRINIGAIGNGRISRTHDMPGIWKTEFAQIMRSVIWIVTEQPMLKNWLMNFIQNEMAKRMMA